MRNAIDDGGESELRTQTKLLVHGRGIDTIAGGTRRSRSQQISLGSSRKARTEL